MIVGPTGGGKSVVINTLVKAQTTMGITTKCITLNPKVCTRMEVLNFLNKRMTACLLFACLFKESFEKSEKLSSFYLKI
jgi:dynein heavy chain, axonemal